MKSSGINEGALAWSRSDEGRKCSRQRAIANLKLIHAAPRCGAKAKSTGRPCRQPGLGRGGRCVYHGGRSGSGETWGVRQWRESELPVVARRMLTKAEHIEILDEERQQRVAAMSSEERQRYEARKIAYAPGPAEARAGRKLMAAYQSTAAPSLQDLTMQELEAMIAELKAQRAARQDEGVFG